MQVSKMFAILSRFMCISQLLLYKRLPWFSLARHCCVFTDSEWTIIGMSFLMLYTLPPMFQCIDQGKLLAQSYCCCRWLSTKPHAVTVDNESSFVLQLCSNYNFREPNSYPILAEYLSHVIRVELLSIKAYSVLAILNYSCFGRTGDTKTITCSFISICL